MSRAPFEGPGPEDLAEQNEAAERNRAAGREALRCLDALERVAAETRLMVDHEDRVRLDVLGARWGVTRQRAMQIDGRARGKLRSALRRRAGSVGPCDPDVALRSDPCILPHRGAPAVVATEAPCQAANSELTVTDQTIIPDRQPRNGERMGRDFGRERPAF